MLRSVQITLTRAAIFLMAQSAFTQNVATQVDISGEWAARVWTENLTLALSRPFQDERRLSNSQASESTIGPFISDCSRRIKCRSLLRARVLLYSTGWEFVPQSQSALAEDLMAQAAAR